MRLSSGREIGGNRGFVGINEGLETAHGYDGDLPFVARPDWMDDDEWRAAEKLTADEQVEIADRMIALWSAFRDRALGAT